MKRDKEKSELGKNHGLFGMDSTLVVARVEEKRERESKSSIIVGFPPHRLIGNWRLRRPLFCSEGYEFTKTPLIWRGFPLSLILAVAGFSGDKEIGRWGRSVYSLFFFIFYLPILFGHLFVK